MKKLSYVLVASLALALLVGGCGYLKKEEFNAEFSAYKDQNAKELADINTKIGNVDQKLDNSVENLKQEVEKAREEAIRVSEQGDADTMAKAEAKIAKGDEAVKTEAMKAAQEAEKAAKNYADAQIKKAIASVSEEAKKDINKSATAVKMAAQEIEKVKAKQKQIIEALTRKPVVVLFESGKAELTDEAKAELDKAIKMIKECPDATLKVVGHADGRPVLSGKFRSNWDLSAARAKAVADYLKANGVENDMMVFGRAHTEPVGDDLANNRRVEIIVVDKL